MHEKNAQFIFLKIPPHLVRLLGKIHALSIEVLDLSDVLLGQTTTELHYSEIYINLFHFDQLRHFAS